MLEGILTIILIILGIKLVLKFIKGTIKFIALVGVVLLGLALYFGVLTPSDVLSFF